MAGAPDLRRVTGNLVRVATRALNPARLRGSLRTIGSTPSAISLRVANRTSQAPVVGEAPVVVSLTSYGQRLRVVHLAIESIAGGRVRPQRLILWTEEESIVTDPPAPLARLRHRGLEILPTTDWGPHKKYYPYAASLEHHELPLVTADDDVCYGRRWLELLLAAHADHPANVIAHRAHRITLVDGRILPYAQWESPDRGETGPRIFATGISGVLYPPRVLDTLREAGTAFTECAPFADDVWLHANTLRSGTSARPVFDGATTYRSVPGTSLGGLRAKNVLAGGNDAQIQATYRAEDVQLMWDDQCAADG